MSGPEAYLAEARKWIGTKESPPNSNRTIFGAELGLNGSPWCGTFQLYVAKHSGNTAAFRGVSTFSTQAALRRFKELGMMVSPDNIQPGDLAIRTNTPTTGHIGVVDHAAPGTLGAVVTIEGNTAYGNDSDGGEVLSRSRSRAWWNGGFVRPAWILTAPAVPVPAAATVPAPEYWVPAIDVAKYQGKIDYAAVAAAGVELAIVKLHNTREVDPSALANVSGFAAAGVPAAGYWYARTWLDRDPAVQAVNDAAWARQLSPFSPFFMADIEAGENAGLDPACKAWWNAYIAALPPRTWLYGGAGYLGQLDQALVARHPVIAARYPRQGANPAPREWDEHALALPAPTWPTAFQWSGWQFTSSGAVPGVPASCDLNIVRRTALPGYPQGVSEPTTPDLAAIAMLVSTYRGLTLSKVPDGAPIFPLYREATAFWQRLLGIEADGVFGEETNYATRKFQRDFLAAQVAKGIGSAYWLPITGVVDSHTWAARLDVPS